MVPISNRMKLIADMIPDGMSVADIGCDHGFISIYLIEERNIPFCVAMDINQGPLERAREHIIQYGLEDKIKTRLSDGAVGLEENETDSAIIAGMGGRLITKILTDSENKFKKMKYFVLSPQSDIPYVRAFLDNNGYELSDEEMILDEEKFYTVIGCKYTGKKQNFSQMELDFGPVLIKKQHPVLMDYLIKEKGKLTEIRDRLKQLNECSETANEGSLNRIIELDNQIKIIEKVLA